MVAAAFVAVAAFIFGCGGGVGPVTSGTTATNTTSTNTTTTTTTAGAGTTTGTFLPPNAILFGQGASTSSSSYTVEALSPTTKALTPFLTGVPNTTSLFVANPTVAKQYIFAANAGDASGALVGIYANSTLTTKGATTVVAPAFASVVSLNLTQDGKFLVFTAYDKTNTDSYLYTVTAGGRNLTQLDTSASSYVSPADSNTIVYSHAPGLVFQLFTRSISAGSAATPAQITTDENGRLLRAGI